MSNKIYVYGCGGFGQEVTALAERVGYTVVAFIDDAYKFKTYEGKPVLDINSIKNTSNITIGIGNPKVRFNLYSKLTNLGFEHFPNLIDQTAVIMKNSIVEMGSIVCAGVVITTSVYIEKFSIVNINATIGHRTVVGCFSNIAPLAALSGDCHIGKQCFLGTGSSIREKIKIGNNIIVGAGSVVVNNLIYDNSIYVGNPARFKKKLGATK